MYIYIQYILYSVYVYIYSTEQLQTAADESIYMIACTVYTVNHRVITSRGAKPCRLLRNNNLLLTCFGSRHCMFTYFSWLSGQG